MMRGGKRNGAGRKVIPDSEKKKRRSIYITDDLYDKVMETTIDDYNTFSQKCNSLIELGLSTIDKTIQEYEVDNSNIFVIKEHKSVFGIKDRDKKTQSKFNVLKFIDLFAGIGGIRKGFEDEFTKCVLVPSGINMR